jgi:inner membrane protein
MDNLCHSLAGLALGEAGLKRRTAYANAALVIGSNLPDIDVLVFMTDVPSVAFRRGWTHGVVGQALLPLLLTAGCLAWDRYRARTRARPPGVRPGAMLALAYLGVLAHVGMDYLNNYGVRLLKPLSEQWVYGDAVFIIDPWLWLMLGVGALVARRWRREWPARLGVGAATVYIAAMVWLASVSRAAVLDAWTMTHGAPPRSLMVGPVPIHPLRKAIIVDAGSHYETGAFRVWPRSVRFDAATIPKNDQLPAAVAARAEAEVRAVLVWARFPFYEAAPAPGGTAVTVRDVRFGDRVGVARVVVPRPPGSGTR